MQLCSVIIAAVAALLSIFMVVCSCQFEGAGCNIGYSSSRLNVCEGHIKVLKCIIFEMYYSLF